MEQNTPKFRLRLNLFDGIVLVIALAVGAVLLWSALKPRVNTEIAPASTSVVRYTVRFQHWPEGSSGLIDPGDQLMDSVKNLEMGRVTAVSTAPNECPVTDHVNRRSAIAVMEGFEDVLVEVEAPCTVSDESITVGGAYALRVGAMAYIKGEGYMASGPIVAMEVEGAQ